MRRLALETQKMTAPTVADRIKLFLARFFWIHGEPPRNGKFLLQEADGEIRYEYHHHDAPGRTCVHFPRPHLRYDLRV